MKPPRSVGAIAAKEPKKKVSNKTKFTPNFNGSRQKAVKVGLDLTKVGYYFHCNSDSTFARAHATFGHPSRTCSEFACAPPFQEQKARPSKKRAFKYEPQDDASNAKTTMAPAAGTNKRGGGGGGSGGGGGGSGGKAGHYVDIGGGDGGDGDGGLRAKAENAMEDGEWGKHEASRHAQGKYPPIQVRIPACSVTDIALFIIMGVVSHFSFADAVPERGAGRHPTPHRPAPRAHQDGARGGQGQQSGSRQQGGREGGHGA
jgi:hypothetical protein